jgi:hypothetical protein
LIQSGIESAFNLGRDQLTNFFFFCLNLFFLVIFFWGGGGGERQGHYQSLLNLSLDPIMFRQKEKGEGEERQSSNNLNNQISKHEMDRPFIICIT